MRRFGQLSTAASTRSGAAALGAPATRLAMLRAASSGASAKLAGSGRLRDFMPKPAVRRSAVDSGVSSELPPYLTAAELHGEGKHYYIETYGCQMNVADTEVVSAVLSGAGYLPCDTPAEADVVLVNTCAIREGAEMRVWNRLRELRAELRKRRSASVVGVLGCMAERLKGKLLEDERLADVVCGPDAYRELPRLLHTATSGQAAIDVRLSLDETYADVAPVRAHRDSVSAFVSIMRGCNNMCSYCIVPFTRGRERSRDAESISREVAALAAMGVREVTLLGQNVNSYATDSGSSSAEEDEYRLREGFASKVPPAKGSLRFAGLLARLAEAHPEVRFRFTSPHPKDFPDDLLHVIAAQPNACESLHIPAQSGSSAVLESMRRGYDRGTYDELIGRVRELLPEAAVSSDFISGFCGETEENHLQTLSLLSEVKYEKAFMFAYSMREKTHAHRSLQDDVPGAIKQRRLREVIDTFTPLARERNDAELGNVHILLLEGTSKKSDEEWQGRTDTGKKVMLPRRAVSEAIGRSSEVELKVGDYVAVRVTESISAHTLRAEPIAKTTIAQFADSRRAGHAAL